MKNIKWFALLFLFNNEVVSWIALTVIATAAIVWFSKEVDREASRPRT